MLSLGFKRAQLLFLSDAACRIVRIHVGLVRFPQADEMTALGPVTWSHTGDHLRAFLQRGSCRRHGFRLYESAEPISPGDRLEEVPGSAAGFGPETMLERIGAHFHRRDCFVDPESHDIRHTGGTAAGRGDGLLRAASDGIGLRAPALVGLFVIDRLFDVHSLCFCCPLVFAIEQRQPVVDRNAACGIQTRRGLEGDHVGPRVIAILAVDRCADQSLHCLDEGAAAIILVLHRRQGFCQSSQCLRSGDAVNGQPMLLLEVLCRRLLLDSKGIADVKSHQQTVSTDRLLAVALTAVLQCHLRSPP